MKIKKLSNGNVQILNNNGSVRYSYPPNWSLWNRNNKIYVSNNDVPAATNYGIDAKDITATVLNDVETPFSGNIDDLALILSKDFFF